MRASGAWLPPRSLRVVVPVLPSAPGVAFLPASKGRYSVIDRATGELLGHVWQTGYGSWSAADPDGQALITDRTGTRQTIGLAMLRPKP